MGGRPVVHAARTELDVDHYRLNLTPQQLDDVARKLALPADDEFRRKLEAGGGNVQPSDGQELLLTYKGRYVRITYQLGRAVKITPQDPGTD